MNLLHKSSDSKFVTRNRDSVSDQSNANYSAGNEIIYDTEVLKFNICDYNDAYILLRSNIMITENIAVPVACKNWATFIKSMTKIDRTKIDGAEDLDSVMLMYDLLEYIMNYFYGFVLKIK